MYAAYSKRYSKVVLLNIFAFYISWTIAQSVCSIEAPIRGRVNLGATIEYVISWNDKSKYKKMKSDIKLFSGQIQEFFPNQFPLFDLKWFRGQAWSVQGTTWLQNTFY